MAQINKNTKITLLLCLLAMILVICFPMFMDRVITKPIHKFLKSEQKKYYYWGVFITSARDSYVYRI